ncbi:YeiH family protein [Rivularia sp. UHCC 0363]|uniref:YeiH family protein n=1 Tax=Rivularia sp. UHCC 0363 TaxID=3110244 RepID=UPI002B204E9E|nr:YeiH family protein [Rivularia sp. UHCC 0363]MEA5596739.1 YeiH family protein [Rivularia sp. UHCC 0363]
MNNPPQNLNEPITKRLPFYSILPGLLLTIGLAILANSLTKIPSLSLFSSLIIAILLGIIVKNTMVVPKVFQPGIAFSLKRILRLSIILLGLRLSLSQILAVGSTGLVIVFVTLVSTFVFTCWFGKQIGVNQKLTKLIAAGTSICGASAIVATNGVVESKDEDVAYAVAIVTIFGTISMLLYPLLAVLFQVTSQQFGIWCGVSIHETAQVIAAAFQRGEVSGEFGTIAKLSRVIFLAPVVLTLGFLAPESSNSAQGIKSKKLPIPWFVLGFIVLMLLNSANIFPETPKKSVTEFNHFLLASSMAGMGLKTSIIEIKQSGIKPLYLGAASWLFISVISLVLIKSFY